jgi:hypothetical protein
MRMIVSTLLLVLTGSGLATARAQTGGTIAGVVRDASGAPIAEADVFALPGKARTRTDSAGKFTLTDVSAGFYHVRVRRIGFKPTEITTDITSNGHADLKFELVARPLILDSVVVSADGKCPTMSYMGFACRRQRGKGVYLTDDDLADKGAVELGEVFTDVSGFRIEHRPTRFGLKPIAYSQRGCLNALVNGRPIALTNQLPRFATEVLAVEIYSLPSSVPVEYQRYVWDRAIRQSSTPLGPDRGEQACSLVVYWTTLN